LGATGKARDQFSRCSRDLTSAAPALRPGLRQPVPQAPDRVLIRDLDQAAKSSVIFRISDRNAGTGERGRQYLVPAIHEPFLAGAACWPIAWLDVGAGIAWAGRDGLEVLPLPTVRCRPPDFKYGRLPSRLHRLNHRGHGVINRLL
jgi:hypothetical protein